MHSVVRAARYNWRELSSTCRQFQILQDVCSMKIILPIALFQDIRSTFKIVFLQHKKKEKIKESKKKSEIIKIAIKFEL